MSKIYTTLYTIFNPPLCDTLNCKQTVSCRDNTNENRVSTKKQTRVNPVINLNLQHLIYLVPSIPFVFDNYYVFITGVSELQTLELYTRKNSQVCSKQLVIVSVSLEISLKSLDIFMLYCNLEMHPSDRIRIVNKKHVVIKR